MNNKHRNTGLPDYRNTHALRSASQSRAGIPEKAKKQPEYRNTARPACSLHLGMAFTLTELLMAVAITAMIGMSVVTVSTALSSAQASTDSMIKAIGSGRYAMRSIDADVRKAGLITAAGEGEMVIWTGDEYADGQINVSELVLIQSDADNQTVERLQVVFPDSMPPDFLKALNVSRTLANVTNVGNVRALLTQGTYSDYLTQRTLAVGVSNFEVVTDEVPPMPQLVLLRLAVGQDAQQITLTNTVHLRTDATEYVSFDDGGIPELDLGGGGSGGDDDRRGGGDDDRRGGGDDDRRGGGGRQPVARPFM